MIPSKKPQNLLLAEDYYRLCSEYGVQHVAKYMHHMDKWRVNATDPRKNAHTIRLWLKRDAARRRYLLSQSAKRGQSGKAQRS